MKRSSQIRLVLIGGLYTGLMSGCGPSTASNTPSAARVYPNDHHVSSLGYYHAPYHAWYPRPYNAYDQQKKLYYHGGQWTPQPNLSIINLSEPSQDALRALNALAQSQAAVRRSGFGSSSRSHSSFSS